MISNSFSVSEISTCGVNVLPTAFGEKVVLRVLDQDGSVLDVDKLGFEEKALNELKENRSNLRLREDLQQQSRLRVSARAMRALARATSKHSSKVWSAIRSRAVPWM